MLRITDAASTNRSLESIRPSGARRPQLPATGRSAARHLSSPCSMCCHARRWLAAKLQQTHEDRRGRSAAAASCGRPTQRLFMSKRFALARKRDRPHPSLFNVPVLKPRSTRLPSRTPSCIHTSVCIFIYMQRHHNLTASTPHLATTPLTSPLHLLHRQALWEAPGRRCQHMQRVTVSEKECSFVPDE